MPSAIAIEVEDRQSGTTTKKTFTVSPVRIGRSGLNELILSAPHVSAYHGALVFDDSLIRFVDASRYSTRVNGSAVPKNVPVDLGPDGGTLEIGDLRLVVRRSAVADDESADPQPAIDRAPPRVPSSKQVDSNRLGPPLVSRTAIDHDAQANGGALHVDVETKLQVIEQGDTAKLLDRAVLLGGALAELLFQSRDQIGIDWLQSGRTANELFRKLMDLDYPDGVVAGDVQKAVALLAGRGAKPLYS